MDRKREPLLPYSEIFSEKTAIKFRNPLGHCLYKRVIVWTALSLFMAAFVLFGKQDASLGPVTSIHNGQDASSVVAPSLSNDEYVEEAKTADSATNSAQQQIDDAGRVQEQAQLKVTPDESSSKPAKQVDQDSSHQYIEKNEEDDEVFDEEFDEELDEQAEDKDGWKADADTAPQKSSSNKGKPTTDQSKPKGPLSDKNNEDIYSTEEDVPEYDQNAEEADMNFLLDGESTEELKQELEILKKMPWLRFQQ